MVKEVEGCPVKTAISPKIAKLEKSLKLIQTSVGGGTRVPSKNYDFSKNCEQLEKSQFLLINYVKCYRR